MVEIVEAYGLCPWAKPARLGGEVAVEVLWGTPTRRHVGDRLRGAAGAARDARRDGRRAGARGDAARAARRFATRSARGSPGRGIAHFHPDSPLDAATAPRIVPYLRRSPDPLLQLVPLSLLDTVRGAANGDHACGAAQDARQQAPAHRGDVADQIADRQSRTRRRGGRRGRGRAAIAADRRRAYAAAGITTGSGRGGC